jgi:hypothetical protein
MLSLPYAAFATASPGESEGKDHCDGQRDVEKKRKKLDRH